MKKNLILLLLLALVMLPLGAQNFDAFKSGFNGFSDAVANSLPFNALIGQNWSDSYIGGFPHFGLGATVGATTIPFAAVENVIGIFNITLPSELSFLEDYGLPIPAYTVDFRIGLPGLPMDIGVKGGYIPPEVQAMLPPDMSMEYLLLGGDVRLALIRGNTLLPDISIGAGYNYLSGSVGLAGILGGDQTLADVGPYTITMSDPELSMNWQTSVIDLRAQISKMLLIIEPYLGVGASYGASTAGGGLSSEILVGATPTPITDAQMAEINTALGDDAPELSGTGISVSSKAGGWAARVYGGVSLKLLVLYLDLTGMYNFTSQSYGASVNLRIQL